jgi:hypothetical protein
MKIPKEMVGRYMSILLPGIPTVEIKIASITTDEIVGIYQDGEEIHIAHDKILAWWLDTGKAARVERARRMNVTKARRKALDSNKSNDQE